MPYLLKKKNGHELKECLYQSKRCINAKFSQKDYLYKEELKK